MVAIGDRFTRVFDEVIFGVDRLRPPPAPTTAWMKPETPIVGNWPVIPIPQLSDPDLWTPIT